MKTILHAATIALAIPLGLLNPPGALAAKPALSPGSGSAYTISATGGICDFSEAIAALAATRQDRSLSDARELQIELGIRRQILSDVIACDQGGIDARIATLKQLPDNAKSLPAYTRITESLADISRYYEDHKKNIPDLGLQGTKDVSRTIASWREGNYLPLIALADNLVLWSGNQQFFDLVPVRLTQISRLAFSLKLVDQDEVSAGFEKAQQNFQAASKENEAAREALNKGYAESALAHIKISLQSLSDTYKVFFELQDMLQNIVK